MRRTEHAAVQRAPGEVSIQRLALPGKEHRSAEREAVLLPIYDNLWFAVAVSVAATIVPAALFAFIASRCPRLHGYEIQPPIIGAIGVLFSLNLAFICNEIWQNREIANTAMAREGDAIRNLARIAANVPDNGGLTVIKAARQYLEVSRQTDFPLATNSAAASGPDGAASSLPALIALSDTVFAGETLERIHPALRPLALAQVATVRDKRLERLALANFEANRVKWLALIFLQFMTVVAIFWVHVKNPRAMFAAIAVFLAAVNPFVTVLYMSQSPFAGLNPLTSARLDAALERLVEIEATLERK